MAMGMGMDITILTLVLMIGLSREEGIHPLSFSIFNL